MQVTKKNTADASTKCTQDPFKTNFSTLIRKKTSAITGTGNQKKEQLYFLVSLLTVTNTFRLD